jgi:ankyrin repeat protein
LHSAVSGRRSSVIIEHLLERGADPLIENARGQTPLALSERAGDTITGLLQAAVE